MDLVKPTSPMDLKSFIIFFLVFCTLFFFRNWRIEKENRELAESDLLYIEQNKIVDYIYVPETITVTEEKIVEIVKEKMGPTIIKYIKSDPVAVSVNTVTSPGSDTKIPVENCNSANVELPIDLIFVHETDKEIIQIGKATYYEEMLGVSMSPVKLESSVVITEEKDNDLSFMSSFSITSGGITKNLPAKTTVFRRPSEPPRNRFYWDPTLMLGANTMWLQSENLAHLGPTFIFSPLSYESKNEDAFRFLSLSTSYVSSFTGNEKSLSLDIHPAMVNFGVFLPLVEDLWVSASIGVNLEGNMALGLSLSTSL